ncbi:hypothetical protein PVAG01_07281 [Phlyctema vagabunda]|uniref:Uncharacterized protein n=1 Tax=Phlyctema vagabunda TaxID=108571 RepID=A0ABR4PC02_9HELO
MKGYGGMWVCLGAVSPFERDIDMIKMMMEFRIQSCCLAHR